MSLYTCRETRAGYRVVKFDSDVNVEAVYELERHPKYISCTCFRSDKETCRHRQMLEVFRASGAVDKGRFYDYDLARWRRPLKMGAWR